MVRKKIAKLATFLTVLVANCFSTHYEYEYEPQYLKDLTKNREISRYSLRSNKGILLVDNSAKAKKTLGDRAFVNRVWVWNRLPLDIRLAISYDNFKSMLKTHFFRLAFYD